MTKNFSSAEIIDFAVAGAQEKYPYWSLNEEKTQVLQNFCREIDDMFDPSVHVLKADVTDDRELRILVSNEKTGGMDYCANILDFFLPF